MAFAGPAEAQTITAPGLVGQPACAGQSEVENPDLGTVTSVSTTGAVLTTTSFNNLYSNLRSRVGDGGPTSFPMRYDILNAKTGASVFGGVSISLGVTITSSNPNFSSSNPNASSLAQKTPYVFVVYTTASGFGAARPLLRRCFMTGGTYTPSNERGQPGYVANTTSGCFSISPRTFQDIRNCLCGRSRIWNDDDQNTAQRRTLGCANAN